VLPPATTHSLTLGQEAASRPRLIRVVVLHACGPPSGCVELTMFPALSNPTHRLLATQEIPSIGLRARWTLTDRHAPAVGSVETNTCPARSVAAHSDARVHEIADKLARDA
jgi:hypothetical protein